MNTADEIKEPIAARDVAAAAAQEGSTTFTQVFSGLGLGLLLGVIAGLSVSPVVQTILGALITVIVAFLSLQGGAEGAAGGNLLSRLKINELRIGSFGFACIVGILFGLFIRSNEVLSSSVKDQVRKWEAAGYSTEQARQFVALQKLGLKPEGKEIIAGDMQKAASSSLFGTLAEMDLCNKISLQRLGDDAQEVLRVYRTLYQEGVQDKKNPLYQKLGALADKIERLPADQQTEMLKAVEEVLCELQRLEK